jgi:DNA-binding NarL/FixJ family response regulator
MRVLLVDDHPMFRAGFAVLLSALDASIEVVHANNCAEAVAQADRAFDLVLLDMQLPDVSGVEALAAIKATFEDVPVVAVSGEQDPALIRRVIDHGAAGYIPKSSHPDILVPALRLVLARGIYLPPIALADAPEEAPAARLESATAVSQLTQRQREVLERALQGKPNKVIARELGISEGTVKAHLAIAFRVLGVRNRTEALYSTVRSLA